jgi:hypothetical protein
MWTSDLENCTLLRPGAGDVGGVSAPFSQGTFLITAGEAGDVRAAVARAGRIEVPPGFTGTGPTASCGSPPFR